MGPLLFAQGDAESPNSAAGPTFSEYRAVAMPGWGDGWEMWPLISWCPLALGAVAKHKKSWGMGGHAASGTHAHPSLPLGEQVPDRWDALWPGPGTETPNEEEGPEWG